jgi:hypothetical protein
MPKRSSKQASRDVNEIAFRVTSEATDETVERIVPEEKERIQVVAALVEGNSIRSTVRMTGVAKNTIVKLLADVGKACSEYQDRGCGATSPWT